MLGRSAIISRIALVVALAAGSTFAQEPQLASPFTVATVDGERIDVGGEGLGYAGPTIADLDGDGIDDLVVGRFTGGNMLWYRGVGESRARRFEPAGFVMAENARASVPMG